MRSNSIDIEQKQKLQDTLRGHELEALIALALVTGLRRDELLSLKWQDVDLDKHELAVQNAKTKSSTRMVPIALDVALLLKEHRLHQMEVQGKAGLTWANLDLVFSDSYGESLNPHHLMKEWRSVIDLAGLPSISFHHLRSAVGQTQYNTRKTKGA